MLVCQPPMDANKRRYSFLERAHRTEGLSQERRRVFKQLHRQAFVHLRVGVARQAQRPAQRRADDRDLALAARQAHGHTRAAAIG
jgi:hypothetical protein